MEKRRKKMFQKIFFLSIPILEMFSIWKFAFALQRDKNRLKLFCYWEEKIFKINLYLLNDIWRKTTRLMFLRILSLLMQRDKLRKFVFVRPPIFFDYGLLLQLLGVLSCPVLKVKSKLCTHPSGKLRLGNNSVTLRFGDFGRLGRLRYLSGVQCLSTMFCKAKFTSFSNRKPNLINKMYPCDCSLPIRLHEANSTPFLD